MGKSETRGIKVFQFRLFILSLPLFLLIFGPSEGQIVDYTPPTKLSAINTPGEDIFPLVTPDGNGLTFVRTLFEKNTKGRLAGQDIWLCKKNSKGNWSDANNNLGSLNNKGNNSIVGFSADGLRIYLLNSYKGRVNKRGLSVSKWTNNTWSSPKEVNIPSIASESLYYGLFMHSTEKILLVSLQTEGGLGQEDLYVILKDSLGSWGNPIHLGPTINTSGFEISPFLTEDGKTLYFASNGHAGLGEADIYMATRLYDSWNVWSKPVNLKSINSSKFDAYFSVSKDSTVYFASNRGGALSDIYQSKIITRDVREVYQLDGLIPSSSPSKKLERVDEAETNKFLGVSIPRIIYFNLNSFEISPEDKELLYYIAGKFENNNTYSLEIVGHTDQEGSKEYNMELSVKRAEAVKGYLTTLGLDEKKIVIVGKGASEPVSKGPSTKNEKNRRAEINFLK